MTGMFGGEAERSQSSWREAHQPAHGCFLVCGGWGGTGAAADGGGGCDGGGDEGRPPRWGGLNGRYGRNENVGLPISAPAEIPEEVRLLDGRSYEAGCPCRPTSAAGGGLSLHPGRRSCCSCPALRRSGEGDACLPGCQLARQREEEEFDWRSQMMSWAAELVPVHLLVVGEEECHF